MMRLKKEKKMRLILVMPPQPGLLKGFYPGLISIANYVDSRFPDVDVQILDLSTIPCNFVENKINDNEVISHEYELIVGITTTTATYQAALSVGRIFKKLAPESILILGGHHVADADTIITSHKNLIDYVVIGEGEKVLFEFLKKMPDVSQVSGLSFFKNGKIYHNPPPPYLTQEELDTLEITFRGNGISGTLGKFDHVTYISARGCPMKCAFCSVGNKKMRFKSIRKVIEEVSVLLKKGFTKIAFEDNFFLYSDKRVKQLCKALKVLRKDTEFKFKWDCQTRVESMAKSDIVALLADAGCEAVYLGVESFNWEHLKYLNKTDNPEEYLELLTIKVIPTLLKSPIDCYLNIQLGIPGECESNFNDTVEILKSLGQMAIQKNKTITVFPQLHVIYPGTVHFFKGIKEGRFKKDVFESFTKWESENAPILNWLGEHFAHGTGGLPEYLMVQKKLRYSDYEVNVNAVLQLSSYLKSIERIPGIRVFQYGGYRA